MMRITEENYMPANIVRNAHIDGILSNRRRPIFFRNEPHTKSERRLNKIPESENSLPYIDPVLNKQRNSSLEEKSQGSGPKKF